MLTIVLIKKVTYPQQRDAPQFDVGPCVKIYLLTLTA
jgi:hypothetical protein